MGYLHSLVLCLCALHVAGITLRKASPLQSGQASVLDPLHSKPTNRSASDIIAMFDKMNGMQTKVKEGSLVLAKGAKKEGEKRVLIVGNYIGIDGQMEDCEHQCTFTTDGGQCDAADAVVLNLAWNDPGQIPCGKREGQKRVANFFYEAPSRWDRRGNLQWFNGDADWTMTFLSKSDFVAPMFKMVPLGKNDPKPEKRNFAQGKDRLVLAFVSNCVGHRMDYINALGVVDVFGACGQGAPCGEFGSDENNECYQELFSHYKFYASFENERCDGYITEKAERALIRGMVPLVIGGMGPEDYHKAGMPPGSFIHTDEHGSPEKLRDYLSNMDEKTYNKHFEWQQHYKVKNGNAAAMCELCNELHSENPKPSRSFGDSLEAWFYDGTCRDYR